MLWSVACGNGEKAPAPVAAASLEIKCKDGVDNDLDGRLDCEDPDCQSPGGDCRPAPALDRSVASTVADTAAFLCTGENPLQRGCDAKSLERRRAAMLHGRVVDGVGAPLAGVQVSVSGHKEYGSTHTRADGAYDLVVNGGSRILLDFESDGYLAAQRAIQPGWQRHETLDDVGLSLASTKTTKIMANSATSQSLAGDAVTDQYGARQPLVVFEPGTVANAVLADGTKSELPSLTIAVTEYPTTDPSRYLPGSPPAGTGASYALSFEVAEAQKLGASHVVFSKPASLFVENFLGLPVGTNVPIRIYDRNSGQWELGQTGRVIEVLQVGNGTAALDVDGDGAADDSTVLGALGITPSALTEVARRYSLGARLWYANIAHFSAVDVQPQLVAPKGAIAPADLGLPRGWVDSPSRMGSILVEPRSLSHPIPIAGTGLALEYQSQRAKGYGAAYQLDLPVTLATIPSGLKRIDYRVRIAGRTYAGTVAAAPNQHAAVTWDGLDSQGRLLQGQQLAEVYLGYVYDGVLPNGKRPSAATEVTLSGTFYTKVGLWDGRGFGLAGFGLNAVHAYDPALHTIYFGYGDQRSADDVSLVTKPANRLASFSLGTPDSLFVTSDGSLLVSDDQQQDESALGRILRISSDGTPAVLAGPGAASSAAKVVMQQPQGVVQLDDGSLVVSDIMKGAIYQIDRAGNARTLIGSDPTAQPELLYQLQKPDGLALGPRQEIYVVDLDRVLVLEAGRLATFAGGGVEVSDGVLATQAKFGRASGVAVARDGTVYISDREGNRIRQVTPDGTIVTVAGTGTAGFSGDGASAVAATLSGPRGLAIGPDGSLYVVDQGNGRIRQITSDGVIQTVIGGGQSPIVDGRLATEVALDRPDGIAVSPDGSLYIATVDTVFQVTQALPSLGDKEHLIPSSDGHTLYRFDKSGKHLATIDALTGVTELAFAYDATGAIVSVTDKDGLVTSIARNAAGLPLRITGPYGQATELDIRADGNIAVITDPLGRITTLEWDPVTGLLTRVTDPKGIPTTIEYELSTELTSYDLPKLSSHEFSKISALSS